MLTKRGVTMIRKLKENDLDKIMAIWLESNIRSHSFIPEGYWKIAAHFVKRAIPMAEVYVYEKDETVCGFIGVEDTYIAGMFVDETYRSGGIGKQLLDYVKNLKPELSLNVYQKNERAIDFYKREQFVIKAESVDGNTNEAEFVMAWTK